MELKKKKKKKKDKTNCCLGFVSFLILIVLCNFLLIDHTLMTRYTLGRSSVRLSFIWILHIKHIRFLLDLIDGHLVSSSEI